MREVSGTTWTFQIMILFILIFAAFLTLVINYFRAYNVKNEFLTIVEKYEGVTTDSLDIIDNYLYGKGYKTMGSCPSSENGNEWYGVSSLTDGNPESVDVKNKKYYYCYNVQDTGEQIYYNVILFYKFNLPVLGEIATFRVKGRTNSMIGADQRIGG